MRGVVLNHMFHKADIAASVALLLIPGDAVTMGLKDGHHIVQAISIHVIDRHDGAAHAGAAIAAKGKGMVWPWFAVVVRGLLPPSKRIDDIHAAVAIDIPGANAVRGGQARLGDDMNCPKRIRILQVRMSPTHGSACHVEQIRLTVAIDVGQLGDLTRYVFHHQVLVPAARLAPRILI